MKIYQILVKGYVLSFVNKTAKESISEFMIAYFSIFIGSEYCISMFGKLATIAQFFVTRQRVERNRTLR